MGYLEIMISTLVSPTNAIIPSAMPVDATEIVITLLTLVMNIADTLSTKQ